jgi:hypothetical protein
LEVNQVDEVNSSQSIKKWQHRLPPLRTSAISHRNLNSDKVSQGWGFPMKYAIALIAFLSLGGCGLSQRMAEQRNAEDDAKCIS